MRGTQKTPPIDTIPLIHQMLEEVAGRLKEYEKARAFAQSLMFRELHAGRINRRLVKGPKAVSRDGLASLTTTSILQRIDEALASTLVSLVGGSPDQYAAVSRLRELVKNAESDPMSHNH